MNSKTKDVHAIKYKMSKAKERCMTYLCSLHSHLQILFKEDLKDTRIEHGFKRAFMSLFDQDDDTFTSRMFLNVDQLQKQLDKDEFQEDGSMAAFWNKIDTGKALDADLVVTKSSGTDSKMQDESSWSENDTDADDADIRPIYDEEPMAEFKGNIIDTKFAKTSVLGKPVLQSIRNQSVVRQPNAFKSERPQISKPRFASQADVKNDLSKPVTQHYFPKRRESAFAKPDQVVASSESRNSSKNMPRFSSNDMVYNYFLEEARKKT
ncbi:hypothetical protein Tco_0959341 [Tanacetum coccineum]